MWTPIWSPDGKKIIYASNFSGKLLVTELLLAGRQKRAVASVPGLIEMRGFTPDVRNIVIGRIAQPGNTIELLNIDTGHLQVLGTSSYLLAFPTISPDGRWLAYVSDETGRWEIYVRAVDKSAVTARVTTEGGEEPIWDKDGYYLYYRNGDKWMKVQVVSGNICKISPPIQVVQGPYINIPGYSYDIAGDGRFLLLKSEYQDRRSTQLEIIENWPALLH